LAGGYTYSTIPEACTDTVTSTESGLTFPMPEDFDGNVVFSAGDETWLLSNHELTEPRPGDFQGDAGKCAVPEQTPGDDDSDGTASVSRIVLAKDGVTVLRRDLITTGIHDTCSVAQTPWKTYLTNEEFPFIDDPDMRSGWIWEIDPATGAHREPDPVREHAEPVRADRSVVLERQPHPVPLGAGRPAVPEQGDRDPAHRRELQPAVRPLETGRTDRCEGRHRRPSVVRARSVTLPRVFD
jgi:hypothetical protein